MGLENNFNLGPHNGGPILPSTTGIMPVMAIPVAASMPLQHVMPMVGNPMTASMPIAFLAEAAQHMAAVNQQAMSHQVHSQQAQAVAQQQAVAQHVANQQALQAQQHAVMGPMGSIPPGANAAAMDEMMQRGGAPGQSPEAYQQQQQQFFKAAQEQQAQVMAYNVALAEHQIAVVAQQQVAIALKNADVTKGKASNAGSSSGSDSEQPEKKKKKVAGTKSVSKKMESRAANEARRRSRFNDRLIQLRNMVCPGAQNTPDEIPKTSVIDKAIETIRDLRKQLGLPEDGGINDGLPDTGSTKIKSNSADGSNARGNQGRKNDPDEDEEVQPGRSKAKEKKQSPAQTSRVGAGDGGEHKRKGDNRH